MSHKLANTVSILTIQIFVLLAFWTFAQAQPMPGDALVIDSSAGTGLLGGLFSVDLTTGNRTLISDFGDSAQGLPLGQDPEGLTLDGLGSALVTDTNAGTNGRGVLFRVDLSTGNRTLVSDFSNAAQGPLGLDPRGVTLDGGGSALVIDNDGETSGRGALFRVDLTTGNRTLVSDFGNATQGLPLGQDPFGVVFNGIGEALVTDGDNGPDGRGVLFRVDLTTGNRTLVSDFDNAAQGPLGVEPFGVILDGSEDALVADQGAGIDDNGALFRVNLTSGNRSIVSDFANAAQGPLGDSPSGVTLDGLGNALVINPDGGTNNRGVLLSVDLSTGNRTLISDFSNAAQGPLGVNPFDVIIIPSGLPECEIRNDYDDIGCSGTFQVFNLTDLDSYVASDFGRNGGSNYMDLKIMADLTDDTLDIESPCDITLSDGVTLSGDFVSLDGRKGVLDDNGYEIDASRACVLSEEDNAGFGAGSVVNADDLLIQGAKTAKIGQNSSFDLVDSLSLVSTGDFTSSKTIIKSGSVVIAGSISMEASRSSFIGQNTNITAADGVSVVSTGDTTGSDAGLNSGASVTAGTLDISASRQARVGQNTTVVVTGDLNLESTGSATGSLAIVKQGADVDVGGNMDQTSGNKSTVGLNTTIDVTNNFNMEAATAAKCTIKSSAVITANTTSGNCFGP